MAVTVDLTGRRVLVTGASSGIGQAICRSVVAAGGAVAMLARREERLTELQSELGNRTVTCSSGGGMVTVTADGRGRVRAIKIDPAVVDPEDVEMLEDLVQAAVSEAQQRAQQVYEEELKKLAGGFPLPFNFPGIP